MSLSLSEKFKKSIFWTLFSNLGTTFLTFTLGVWLARILGPNIYGLVAMVLVITGFSKLFIDFGFGEALIQHKDVKQKDFSTVFWFNLILSLILCLVIFFGSNFIGDFYKNQNIIPLTKVLSIVVVLYALHMVQRIKLEKEMRFKEIGISEFASSFISFILAIICALKGMDIWSLVVLHLSKPIIYTLFLFFYTRWIPTITFSISSIKKISSFSLSIFVNGIFEMISSNIDKVLIGRYFGDMSLGLYGKSVSSVRMPVNIIMSSCARVIFPLFSNIQDDKERIFKIYKYSVFPLTLIAFSFSFVFYAFGDEIVKLIFGSKWLLMIPVFKIMSLGIIVLPFNILIDSVVKSIGNPKYLNYITFYEKPITIICLVIGVLIGGIYEIAIMLNISLVINFFLKSFIMTNSLQVPFIDLFLLHFKSLRIITLPFLVLFYFIFSIEIFDFEIKLIIAITSYIVSVAFFKKELFYQYNFTKDKLLKK